MIAHVYIIMNPDGRIYVGATSNIRRRLHEHSRGQSRSTRGKGPWKLVYAKEFPTLLVAKKRETEIKRRKSRVYIESLVAAQSS